MWATKSKLLSEQLKITFGPVKNHEQEHMNKHSVFFLKTVQKSWEDELFQLKIEKSCLKLRTVEDIYLLTVHTVATVWKRTYDKQGYYKSK